MRADARCIRLRIVTGAFPLRSQSFITNKAILLAERGHQVEVLASHPGDIAIAQGDWSRAAGRLLVRYRRPTSWLSSLAVALHQASILARHPGALMALWPSLRRESRPLRAAMREIWDASFFLESVPDITHFEWSTKAAELSALLPLLEGRIVVSCRGSDVRILPLANPGLQGRLRAVFARADRVHCVARAVQQSAERYGLDASRAFVNHPSIDIERFTPRQAVTAVQPSFRILSIGRLHWVKGIEYALQAVALLVARGHDVHYRIVGPGSAEVQAQLVYTIDALALTDHVELVGPVSPTEATRELHVADAYLLSSLSEGISNAVLEAMASGVPVVSTDVGGMAEAIVHERDGLLVQAREPAAMADALERLLTDRELRTRLAANARARTEREFSIDRQIDVFEREYSNLLGGE